MNYQEFFEQITAMESEGISETEIDAYVSEGLIYGKALFAAYDAEGTLTKWVI